MNTNGAAAPVAHTVPAGVRFITPNAVMVMPNGALERLDVLDQVGNVPTVILSYDDAKPERLRQLLHDPFSRALCEKSLNASYAAEGIERARDVPELMVSEVELEHHFGKGAGPLLEFVRTHPDAPREVWIPKLYDAIATHLEADAEAICQRARDMLRHDFRHHEAMPRKEAHADYWHQAMVHAPTPGFQSLYFMLSHILHTEAEIAQDRKRDTEENWHQMREHTMEAFGSLPDAMQQLMAHRGLMVLTIDRLDTDVGGYATKGYDLLCINHAGADEHEHKLQVVMNEEAMHKMDEWFGFTTRPEWIAAAKADMTRPDARAMLDLLRGALGGKTPIDGRDADAQAAYGEDEMPYELLPELFNLKYFDLHLPDKTLTHCFPHCAPLLAQFEAELEAKAAELGQAGTVPSYRVESAGLHRHLHPVRAPEKDPLSGLSGGQQL